MWWYIFFNNVVISGIVFYINFWSGVILFWEFLDYENKIFFEFIVKVEDEWLKDLYDLYVWVVIVI